MKKAVTFFISLVLIMQALTPLDALAAPDNSAYSVILTETKTGKVLFEENADERLPIASTTKIMTALVVLENCSLDEKVFIKDEYTYVEGSSMYLQPGDTLTVRDLLYGLLLASGNDAALALACHTSGSVEGFARLMNDKASELGCTDASFKNPHGLDEEGHYCSARDLAKITAAAMEKKDFSDIVSTKNITVSGRSYTNHNKLLWYYDGAVGVKTGYTSNAGRSLVSCVKKDGMSLVCVTLSDPDDWDDHMNLYDWAFENYRMYSVPSAGGVYGPVPVISGTDDEVQVYPEESLYLLTDIENEIDISVELPRFVYAPVHSGDYAGALTVTVSGGETYKIPLIFTNEVPADLNVPLGRWERMKRTLGMWFD